MQKAEPTAIGGVGEAFGGDYIPVSVGFGLVDMAVNGLVGQQLCTQIGQDPQRVELAGRLDDPGDHQAPEHRISQGIEAEPGIDLTDHVIEQSGTGRDPPARPAKP
jgi:hypothetical protein